MKAVEFFGRYFGIVIESAGERQIRVKIPSSLDRRHLRQRLRLFKPLFLLELGVSEQMEVATSTCHRVPEWLFETVPAGRRDRCFAWRVDDRDTAEWDTLKNGGPRNEEGMSGRQNVAKRVSEGQAIGQMTVINR